MLVVHDRAGLDPRHHPIRGAALTIGNFDGVHLGHGALVDTAIARARARGAKAAVLTFDPHPARFFAPAVAPPLLTSLPRRLELLFALGIDAAVVERFDAAFAHLAPEAFVADVLAASLGVRDVVVGFDFSFGRGRSGDPEALRRLARPLGIEVHVVPRVERDGVACSSSNVRRFVREGRMEAATALLGRPFEIEGEVVRGAGRGKALGIPTANLRPTAEVLPAAGIYAARARIVDALGGPWPVALSIGTNPTFTGDGGGPVTVEAHLLDFEGDLYGRTLRLDVVQRLRDEKRFPGVDALMAQIAQDVAATRRVLA